MLNFFCFVKKVNLLDDVLEKEAEEEALLLEQGPSALAAGIIHQQPTNIEDVGVPLVADSSVPRGHTPSIAVGIPQFAETKSFSNNETQLDQLEEDMTEMLDDLTIAD